MICPHCKKEIEPVDEFTSTVNVVVDEERRMKTWTEEIRDTDNVLLSKRVDEYTYFDKSGDIHKILQKIYDGDGLLLSEQQIKHFEDGKQPVIESIHKIDMN